MLHLGAVQWDNRARSVTTLKVTPPPGAEAIIRSMPVDLHRIASRVVWWEAPERVVARENDFLCRVMTLGTLQDALDIERHFGRDRMAQALRQAPAGVMDARSWSYWHARLGAGPASAMPVRRLA
jgi:hypothetical protein